MADAPRTFLDCARGDVEALRKLVVDGNLSPAGPIAFHAQQAIEKTIKHALETHEIEVPHVHPVGSLLDLARAEGLVDEVPQAIREAAAHLTRAEAKSRYPDDFDIGPRYALDAIVNYDAIVAFLGERGFEVVESGVDVDALRAAATSGGDLRT